MLTGRTLEKLDEVKVEFEKARQDRMSAELLAKKEKIMELEKDLQHLWKSTFISSKDRKRILRLLIKDITVNKDVKNKVFTLSIRWQGGSCDVISVPIPLRSYEKWRHSPDTVDRIRELAKTMSDQEIVDLFSEENLKTNKGKPFTLDGVRWVRHKHSIPLAKFNIKGEVTVKEVMQEYNASYYLVNSWIKRNEVKARKKNNGSQWWIMIDPETDLKLKKWISTRGWRKESEKLVVGGAV